MVPQPTATFEQPLRLTNPAGARMPRTYVLCTEGKEGLPECVQRVRADPAWRYVELPAGHGAHVTAPQQLIEVLIELVRDARH